jgi:hypothetical protein
MTNEELDIARVDEAMRLWDGSKGSLAVIAARLAREGWTPPVAVDPDLTEAREIVARLYDVSWPERANAIRAGDQDHNVENVSALAGIARGRALANAEAKPGMVWAKHEQSNVSPAPGSLVTVRFHKGHYETGQSFMFDWWRVDHYAIITPPEEK